MFFSRQLSTVRCGITVQAIRSYATQGVPSPPPMKGASTNGSRPPNVDDATVKIEVDQTSARRIFTNKNQKRSYYGVRSMFDDVFSLAGNINIESEGVRQPLKCFRASVVWHPVPSVRVTIARKTGRPQSSMQSDVRSMACAAVWGGREAWEIWRHASLVQMTPKPQNSSTIQSPLSNQEQRCGVLDYNLSLPPLLPEARPLFFDCDVGETRAQFESMWVHNIDWRMLETLCVKVGAQLYLELEMRPKPAQPMYGSHNASVALPQRSVPSPTAQFVTHGEIRFDSGFLQQKTFDCAVESHDNLLEFWHNSAHLTLKGAVNQAAAFLEKALIDERRTAICDLVRNINIHKSYCNYVAHCSWEKISSTSREVELARMSGQRIQNYSSSLPSTPEKCKLVNKSFLEHNVLFSPSTGPVMEETVLLCDTGSSPWSLSEIIVGGGATDLCRVASTGPAALTRRVLEGSRAERNAVLLRLAGVLTAEIDRRFWCSKHNVLVTTKRFPQNHISKFRQDHLSKLLWDLQRVVHENDKGRCDDGRNIECDLDSLTSGMQKIRNRTNDSTPIKLSNNICNTKNNCSIIIGSELAAEAHDNPSALANPHDVYLVEVSLLKALVEEENLFARSMREGGLSKRVAASLATLMVPLIPFTTDRDLRAINSNKVLNAVATMRRCAEALRSPETRKKHGERMSPFQNELIDIANNIIDAFEDREADNFPKDDDNIRQGRKWWRKALLTAGEERLACCGLLSPPSLMPFNGSVSHHNSSEVSTKVCCTPHEVHYEDAQQVLSAVVVHAHINTPAALRSFLGLPPTLGITVQLSRKSEDGIMLSLEDEIRVTCIFYILAFPQDMAHWLLQTAATIEGDVLVRTADATQRIIYRSLVRSEFFVPHASLLQELSEDSSAVKNTALVKQIIDHQDTQTSRSFFCGLKGRASRWVVDALVPALLRCINLVASHGMDIQYKQQPLSSHEYGWVPLYGTGNGYLPLLMLLKFGLDFACASTTIVVATGQVKNFVPAQLGQSTRNLAAFIDSTLSPGDFMSDIYVDMESSTDYIHYSAIRKSAASSSVRMTLSFQLNDKTPLRRLSVSHPISSIQALLGALQAGLRVGYGPLASQLLERRLLRLSSFLPRDPGCSRNGSGSPWKLLQHILGGRVFVLSETNPGYGKPKQAPYTHRFLYQLNSTLKAQDVPELHLHHNEPFFCNHPESAKDVLAMYILREHFFDDWQAWIAMRCHSQVLENRAVMKKMEWVERLYQSEPSDQDRSDPAREEYREDFFIDWNNFNHQIHVEGASSEVFDEQQPYRVSLYIRADGNTSDSSRRFHLKRVQSSISLHAAYTKAVRELLDEVLTRFPEFTCLLTEHPPVLESRQLSCAFSGQPPCLDGSFPSTMEIFARHLHGYNSEQLQLLLSPQSSEWAMIPPGLISYLALLYENSGDCAQNSQAHADNSSTGTDSAVSFVAPTASESINTQTPSETPHSSFFERYLQLLHQPTSLRPVFHQLKSDSAPSVSLGTRWSVHLDLQGSVPPVNILSTTAPVVDLFEALAVRAASRSCSSSSCPVAAMAQESMEGIDWHSVGHQCTLMLAGRLLPQIDPMNGWHGTEESRARVPMRVAESSVRIQDATFIQWDLVLPAQNSNDFHFIPLLRSDPFPKAKQAKTSAWRNFFRIFSPYTGLGHNGVTVTHVKLSYLEAASCAQEIATQPTSELKNVDSSVSCVLDALFRQVSSLNDDEPVGIHLQYVPIPQPQSSGATKVQLVNQAEYLIRLKIKFESISSSVASIDVPMTAQQGRYHAPPHNQRHGVRTNIIPALVKLLLIAISDLSSSHHSNLRQYLNECRNNYRWPAIPEQARGKGALGSLVHSLNKLYLGPNAAPVISARKFQSHNTNAFADAGRNSVSSVETRASLWCLIPIIHENRWDPIADKIIPVSASGSVPTYVFLGEGIAEDPSAATKLAYQDALLSTYPSVQARWQQGYQEVHTEWAFL